MARMGRIGFNGSAIVFHLGQSRYPLASREENGFAMASAPTKSSNSFLTLPGRQNDSSAREDLVPMAPFLRSRSSITEPLASRTCASPQSPDRAMSLSSRGLFADVAAVTTCWKLNPVNFDSVRKSFEEAVTDQGLYARSRAGWDFAYSASAGPGHDGPCTSPLLAGVSRNIRFVDHEMQEFTEIIKQFYGDDKTAFIFTADHGMSNWGSHGDGHPHNTRTVPRGKEAPGHEDGLTAGYLGWIEFAFTTSVDLHVLHGKVDARRSPGLIHSFILILFWDEVFAWSRRALAEGKKQPFSQFSKTDAVRAALNCAAYLALLEVMVQNHYKREVYTIVYLFAIAWPLLYGTNLIRINFPSVLHALSCAAMSVFTLLPANK
ncbi:uncharacterized protein BP01DRAFT_383908 [Aspergillus saccharolyticus JOP 1030-1]|uniref:GPI ethanolamine phosphate transferase 1 n=1 Tax=Aspergillus saccharolyticus JOP 1030-1 TaxID=1450539 RepID=A0A318ZVF2_9EURO|nr:hypothetical protein BP01DRAFT_383908 [Aspergillus saccharolyticus JOP 1030-1]PYH44108.1 hypothetical protein BP01DRAFT_383908 [Aspergillus saccharolyticus JOP 1030-1]